MADINKRFLDIKEKLQELTKQYPQGCLLMVSLRNTDKNTTAGQFTEVSLAKAAEHLVDGTYRMTTEDEQKAYVKSQDETREALRVANVESARRHFGAIMNIPMDIPVAVAPVVAPVPAPVRPPVVKPSEK